MKDGTELLGPVRDSKAFLTEDEVRAYADDLKAAGYGVVIWRERQDKMGSRWITDLDDPTTQPLDE